MSGCFAFCSCSILFVTMILPFTLEGDRWRVAGTFDTGTLQQELDRPSCKRFSLALKQILATFTFFFDTPLLTT